MDLHLSESVGIAVCAVIAVAFALKLGWGVRASVDKKGWHFETKEQKPAQADDD